jgi:hypothetical protein
MNAGDKLIMAAMCIGVATIFGGIGLSAWNSAQKDTSRRAFNCDHPDVQAWAADMQERIVRCHCRWPRCDVHVSSGPIVQLECNRHGCTLNPEVW